MMASLYVTFKNGYKMPMVGLGTWRTDAKIVANVIKDAIDIGYRHFDCAHIYDNEKEVGIALQEKIQSGDVQRQDLFITSKLWNTFHHPDLVEQACRTSLANLKTDYLDLFLIHWPMAYKDGFELRPQNSDGKISYSDVHFCDTWRAMEKLVDAKLCCNIGLSNFNATQIQCILDVARIRPQLLQVESHPYLLQKELLEFCQKEEIAVAAYSPLGSGHTPYVKPGDYPLLAHPKILQIAETYQRSPAQILLRFQLQRNIAVLPRSINKEHMKSNLESHNFQISNLDMDDLKTLDMGDTGRIVRMDDCIDHPLYPFGGMELKSPVLHFHY